MPAEDQDFEWCACILIDASTATEALNWGNGLARDFSKRNETELFLSSYVAEYHKGEFDDTSTPHIKFGERATDEKIGW